LWQHHLPRGSQQENTAAIMPATSLSGMETDKIRSNKRFREDIFGEN
jgi:hypothetical protein